MELQMILKRLKEGDERMTRLEDSLVANTSATNEIAANTAGIVKFTTDLERGARLLCRMAMGIDWAIEKVMRVWKPVAAVAVLIYFAIYHTLPEWLVKLAKATAG